MKLRIKQVSYREIAVVFSVIFLLSMSLQSIPIPVKATSSSFTENFWTSTYKDDASTTVAGWGSGIISNPNKNPTLAGAYNYHLVGNCYDVVVDGNYAYVPYGDFGLVVVNVSDPTNPTLAGVCDTPGFALGVAIAGDYAFVADQGGGLQVVNITNPSSPTIAGSYSGFGETEKLVVAGNYLYIADGSSGLQVVDISTPTNPVPAGVYNTPGYAYGVYVAGNLAFVADGTGGLSVVNMVLGVGNTIAMADYFIVNMDNKHHIFIEVDKIIY